MRITRPDEMADMMKSELHSDESASESEVIRDGLRTFLVRDRVMESWLNNQVAPAYDALKSNPARAITADQVRDRLAAEYAKTR